MTKLIPTGERIARARALIEKARSLPQPDDRGWGDFSYSAQVKDTLRQANDLIKFVPMISGVTPELKQEAQQVIKEIAAAEKEILHRSLES
ncbi:MAG: hypothetical protein FD147_2479 [Chloroflexi bacterium]|nr:MAG: hypothetical protein FD147_2479 [Chloroflexota bacterium]MBA4376754.1 hypothetical protein [Anaerolinea sp.]